MSESVPLAADMRRLARETEVRNTVSAIKDAARRGETQLVLENTLSDAVAAKLRANGFRVGITVAESCDKHVVSWRKDDDE